MSPTRHVGTLVAMSHFKHLVIHVAVTLAFATAAAPCTAQSLTTTLIGDWKIDVPASIEASREAGNDAAFNSSKSLPADVVARFNADGSFTWYSQNSGETDQSKGTWMATAEDKDRLHVTVKWPHVTRHPTVIIPDKDTLQFHFREGYPICVYKRVMKSEE